MKKKATKTKRTISIRVRNRNGWHWMIAEGLGEVNLGYGVRETRVLAKRHALRWFAEYMPNCEVRFIK